MTVKFSLLSNGRTYGIELRERNYPTFEGKYNAYIAVYGELSGDYLGSIETPVKMNVTPCEIDNLINVAEPFIYSHGRVSIW